MRRDLERRLKAAEKRRGGPAAAIQWRIEALSDEELVGEILAFERDEPSRILDPRTMTDAELEQCIAELERKAEALSAEPTGSRAGPAAVPLSHS